MGLKVNANDSVKHWVGPQEKVTRSLSDTDPHFSVRYRKKVI